jgi:hypothetical protein
MLCADAAHDCRSPGRGGQQPHPGAALGDTSREIMPIPVSQPPFGNQTRACMLLPPMSALRSTPALFAGEPSRPLLCRLVGRLLPWCHTPASPRRRPTDRHTSRHSHTLRCAYEEEGFAAKRRGDRAAAIQYAIQQEHTGGAPATPPGLHPSMGSLDIRGRCRRTRERPLRR